jgi:hypothetical protein
MNNMQGGPPTDGLDMLVNKNNGGILESIEAGFHVVWALIVGFLCWPFLLVMPFPKITTWEIIFIEVIWLGICITGYVHFRRRR